MLFAGIGVSLYVARKIKKTVDALSDEPTNNSNNHIENDNG